MSREKQYWDFRVDVRNPHVYPNYYNTELNIPGYYNTKEEKKPVLRQGWGYEEGHNLKCWNRKNVPPGLRANFRMYDEVKRGDIILIPRIPKQGTVTIAEATEDWKDGYRFEIDPKQGDYGHQFPAEYRTHFSRRNKHVSEDVASTLKCRSRFWNMSYHGEGIENLLRQEPADLINDQESRDRYADAIRRAIDSVGHDIEIKVHKELAKQFAGSGWEDALVEGLKALFPHFQVERTGGQRGRERESEHGTDILVTMPSPLESVQYGIAIQVKDWKGDFDFSNIDGTIKQIQKADGGWPEAREGLRIVEKIVIVTEAKPHEGLKLDEIERKGDTKILHSDELKKLLRRMALVTAATMDE